MKKGLTTGMFTALLMFIASATPSNADNHSDQDLVPPENSLKTSGLNTINTVTASCVIYKKKTDLIGKAAQPKESSQGKSSQSISKFTNSLPKKISNHCGHGIQLEIAKKEYLQSTSKHRAKRHNHTNNPPIQVEPTGTQLHDHIAIDNAYQTYGNGEAALIFLGSIVWIIGLIIFFTPSKNKHPCP